MSNVLGNLFEEIANAIREKTGGTDTMKPAEFPAEIAAIPVGGGGGGDASGAIKYKDGYFECYSGQGSIRTINHNLGVVPDILIVTYNNVPSSGILQSSVAYTSKMLEVFGGGWLSKAQGVTVSGSVYGTSNTGVDIEQDGVYVLIGGIRNVTSTSFDIGSTTYALPTTGSYSWTVIGGITG